MKRTLIGMLVLVLATALAVAGPALAGGKAKGKGKSKTCRSTVAYVLKGTAGTVGSDSLAMTVSGANKRARALVGQDVTVTIGTATKIVRDDESAALSEVATGDTLNVMVRGCKDADVATLALLARHIVAVSPAPAEDEPAEEAATGDSAL